MIDTTTWPVVDSRLTGSAPVMFSQQRRSAKWRPFVFILRDGRSMSLVPTVPDVMRGCAGCMFCTDGDFHGYCQAAPDCTGRVFVEATPETVAQWTADHLETR